MKEIYLLRTICQHLPCSRGQLAELCNHLSRADQCSPSIYTRQAFVTKVYTRLQFIPLSKYHP